MGGLLSWWVAALDSRVKVCIDLAAQVDIETLLLHRRLDHHGFYYYVPNLLTAYTTPMEEIMIETNEEVQQEKDHQFMDTFEGELKKNWNAGRILPNADWCDTKCRPSMCRSGRRIYAGTHWLPIVYNRWSHPISFSTRKDLYDGKLVTSILLICIRNHFASRLPTESFKNCIYW